MGLNESLLTYEQQGEEIERLTAEIEHRQQLLEAAEQYVKYAENGTKHISDHSWNTFQILKDAIARCVPTKDNG